MPKDTQSPRTAREWLSVLKDYREPSLHRSLFELVVTAVPLFAIWALAWAALSVHPLISLLLAMVNGAFLVRLFIIQHDCGHGAFLENRKAQDWLGRICGVLTLTPYAVWRRTHAIHHAHHGNLEQRGIGDVTTLTVAEYQARSSFGQFMYRLYRHPLFLFGLAPSYLFILQNRLPVGLMRSGRGFWISAMGTNVAVLLLLAGVYWLGGYQVLLFIYLPTVVMAATIGVWLFYVQHQFEDTHWYHADHWQVHSAALEGSSHYVLPQPLRWLSGNIGIHHVHHLYARIPFYRLPEVIENHKELAESQRLTIRQSFATVKFHLWDEIEGRLRSFADVKASY